jgi:hypothetical protein
MSGYYLHLEPPNLLLGFGIHNLSKDLLKAYREAVVDRSLDLLWYPQFNRSHRAAITSWEVSITSGFPEDMTQTTRMLNCWAITD